MSDITLTPEQAACFISARNALIVAKVTLMEGGK